MAVTDWGLAKASARDVSSRLGGKLELSGSTGRLWVLHALLSQTKRSFFFRASLCDITTCIPIFNVLDHQREQVLVFSSLCNFCAKPDFSLSLGLRILRFFSFFGKLQVGACVGVLRQLSSWQGIRSKILYKTLIAYLAFANEFILFGRWWQTLSLSRITWR